MNEQKPITIQDVCERWQISRPTVMQAIAKRKLIGAKRQGKWFFYPSAVVQWRGEAPEELEPALAPEVSAAPAADPSMIATLLKMAEDHIATLKEQLDVKDRQLAESQETMREQMRLLTYAGPALTKTTDEVEELKQQLAQKDRQLAKLEKVMVEKVALLMKQQQKAEQERVARPKVVTAADQLEGN